MKSEDERYERLADTDYLGSLDHVEDMEISNDPRLQPVLREFFVAFTEKAAAFRIPIYMEEANIEYGYCRILHCLYGMCLARDDWSIIGGIGIRALSALGHNRVEWGGNGLPGLPDGGYRPDVWYVARESESWDGRV